MTLFRRWMPRLGYNKAMWAVVHRLCRLTWKILHHGVRSEERGHLPDPRLVQARKNKLVRQLKQLGYEVQLKSPAGRPTSQRHWQPHERHQQ